MFSQCQLGLSWTKLKCANDTETEPKPRWIFWELMDWPKKNVLLCWLAGLSMERWWAWWDSRSDEMGKKVWKQQKDTWPGKRIFFIFQFPWPIGLSRRSVCLSSNLGWGSGHSLPLLFLWQMRGGNTGSICLRGNYPKKYQKKCFINSLLLL